MVGERARWWRPWCLPLTNRVLLVAVYYGTNLTMRQFAPLFGASRVTVCRVIKRLRQLLTIELATRTTGASSRTYWFSRTSTPTPSW